MNYRSFLTVAAEYGLENVPTAGLAPQLNTSVEAHGIPCLRPVPSWNMVDLVMHSSWATRNQGRMSSRYYLPFRLRTRLDLGLGLLLKRPLGMRDLADPNICTYSTLNRYKDHEPLDYLGRLILSLE
jgi:hypothetical protein